MTKLTFVQKVLERLKGGDEAKVARFHKKIVKFAKTQISIRENEIEDCQEKIDDLKERYTETLLTVDLERIKDSDSLDSYVDTYVNKVFASKKAIAEKEAEIETKRKEIAKFEALALDLD